MNPVSLTQLEILHLYQNKTKAKTNNKKKKPYKLTSALGELKIALSTGSQSKVKVQSPRGRTPGSSSAYS